MSRDRPGVIGEAGTLRQVRAEFTELLLATYAEPLVGTLYHVVPIANRLLPAANDPEAGNAEQC